MISIVKYLSEVLGDDNRTNRLIDAGFKYHDEASKTKGLDSEKLKLMGDRASALGRKNLSYKWVTEPHPLGVSMRQPHSWARKPAQTSYNDATQKYRALKK